MLTDENIEQNIKTVTLIVVVYEISPSVERRCTCKKMLSPIFNIVVYSILKLL